MGSKPGGRTAVLAAKTYRKQQNARARTNRVKVIVRALIQFGKGL